MVRAMQGKSFRECYSIPSVYSRGGSKDMCLTPPVFARRAAYTIFPRCMAYDERKCCMCATATDTASTCQHVDS